MSNGAFECTTDLSMKQKPSFIPRHMRQGYVWPVNACLTFWGHSRHWPLCVQHAVQDVLSYLVDKYVYLSTKGVSCFNTSYSMKLSFGKQKSLIDTADTEPRHLPSSEPP